MTFIKQFVPLGYVVKHVAMKGHTATANDVVKDKARTCKLVIEDKDKDFPRGQQHWVTVKNDLLTQ